MHYLIHRKCCDSKKNNNLIFHGNCNAFSLWHGLLLSIKSLQQANGIICLDCLKQELVHFHHAFLGSVAISTLLQAICCGFLFTFLWFTFDLILQHFLLSVAAALGYQDQEAKKLWNSVQPSNLLTDSDIIPPSDEKTNIVNEAITHSDN